MAWCGSLGGFSQRDCFIWKDGEFSMRLCFGRTTSANSCERFSSVKDLCNALPCRSSGMIWKRDYKHEQEPRYPRETRHDRKEVSQNWKRAPTRNESQKANKACNKRVKMPSYDHMTAFLLFYYKPYSLFGSRFLSARAFSFVTLPSCRAAFLVGTGVPARACNLFFISFLTNDTAEHYINP